jgi:CheY-like chemotaxis protein
MAAAEILRGTNMNAYQDSLMDTINACGRTLLDTMNQVLDFSKIVSLERQFRHSERRKVSPLEMKNIHLSAAHLDAHVATDVSILAEEVVEGVFLGHFHTQNSTDSSALLIAAKANEGSLDTNIPRPNVDVIIDIAPDDWIYHTPPGALRRIIMNIFSNAIKYTKAGHVSLHLEAKEISETCVSRHGTKEQMVTLTVSDTGKGISEGFLRSKLFVPFAQEDSLVTGSGLGLSIVRSLVKSLGGSINVSSRVGIGTTVKVTLPLARSEQGVHDDHFAPMSPSVHERDPPLNEVQYLREAHSGRHVAIMNLEPEDAFNHPSWGVLARYLTDWYGLILVSPTAQEPIDLILGDELPSQSEMHRCFTDKNTAFLMLSSNYLGRDSIQVQWASGSKIVDIINRPCGPQKLGRFIHKCLGKDAGHPTMKTTIPDRPAKPDTNEYPTPNNESQDPETHSSSATPSERSLSTLDTERTDLSVEPRSARVLVVEDNKINLNLMLAFLKERNLAAVDSAENGSVAVSAVKQEQQGYDIIFMGESTALFPVDIH